MSSPFLEVLVEYLIAAGKEQLLSSVVIDKTRDSVTIPCSSFLTQVRVFFLHILILFRLQALYLLLLIHQSEFMVLMQSHHFQKQQDKLLNCLLKLTIPLPGHISFNKVSNVTNLKIL